MDVRRRTITEHDKFLDSLRLLGFKSYNDYLQSDVWDLFNTLYRSTKMPQACLVCESEEFELHHVCYEKVGFEDVFDVVPFCREHHRQVHVWLKKNKWCKLCDVRAQLLYCFKIPHAKVVSTCNYLNNYIAKLDKRHSQGCAGSSRKHKPMQRARQASRPNERTRQ